MDLRTVSFTNSLTLKLSPQNTSRYQELNFESVPCSFQQGWKLIRVKIFSRPWTQIINECWVISPGAWLAMTIRLESDLSLIASVTQPYNGLPREVRPRALNGHSERPPREYQLHLPLTCESLPWGMTSVCEPRQGCPLRTRFSRTQGRDQIQAQYPLPPSLNIHSSFPWYPMVS